MIWHKILSTDAILAELTVFERGKNHKKNVKKYTQCVQFNPSFSFRRGDFFQQSLKRESLYLIPQANH
jgi:hypothetical protein